MPAPSEKQAFVSGLQELDYEKSVGLAGGRCFGRARNYRLSRVLFRSGEAHYRTLILWLVQNRFR